MGVTGSVSFDGSANASITATITDNSHNHSDLSGTVIFSGSIGNTYYNSNIMVNGNGTANTIKPSIGFHQPNVYAGTLAMLDSDTFQFKKQDGITSAILDNSITGNAGTATALQTARTINGVAFDGTADITVSSQTSITTEFITEMVRNTKQVYGIEVDIGLMPNATVKDVAFTFNALYTYWIDNQNSYCTNSSASYPINYAGNIGESISCYLDRTNNLIKVLTSDDKSTFTGKVVLLYTK